jgi:hypothetical protein
MTSASLADPSARKRRRSPSRYPLHAGKIPQRVIEYLVSYGEGVEKSTGVILDDLGIRNRELHEATKRALKYGVLTKRIVGGQNYWSVCSGKEST